MTEGNFTDYVKIQTVSGNGGMGSAHLRREKFVPFGGPDGGDGGKGGDIIVRGNKQLWTLFHFKFKRIFNAESGGNGGKSRSSGADGQHAYVDVPLGTVVKDALSDEVLFEISEDGEERILLKGGKGGLGNWNFRTSTKQTPRYAQSGIKGEAKEVVLELKVLADVGLVGFPNAGKSTLLSVMTSAKPKIADYAFTTLKPNLGIVKYHGYQSFVMADIPGIIEHAAEGKGLGHHFLRHIERNAVLLFIISTNSPDIVAEYKILVNELKKYNADLLHKKSLIAISKSDLLTADAEKKLRKKLDKDLGAGKYSIISAVANKGIEELKDSLWKCLQ